jgi:Ca2+-binding RTX toxin-like protein
VFFAGSASGSLYGGEGNDLVSGADGQDAMYGGEGDDWIDGNWQSETTSESDSLYGGAGRDALFGKGGDDVIYGGAGNESGQIATASPDTFQDNLVDFTTLAGLYGGAGNDYLDGGAGDDWIEGGTGDDEAYGGSGIDTIAGDAGNDMISGGSGNDFLRGGDGNDVISGGEGDDEIAGGTGTDVLRGGDGADQFFFLEAPGTANADAIRDFSRKEGDKLLLLSTVFDAIGTSLSKKEFVKGGKAKDDDDFVLYKNGRLFYDEDGKGGTGKVLIATLDKSVKLSHADFDVLVA